MSFVTIPPASIVQTSATSENAGLPLDVLGAAAASYSLRLLTVNYAGNCMKVRRSSDDAELDIGFVNGAFDSASFSSFIGGGSGFVTTLYDQSGSKNLIQATSGSQPQVVLEDGRYVIKFTGGKFLQVASFVGTTSKTTTSVIWKAPTTVPSGFLSQQPGFDFDSDKILSPWWTVTQGMTYNKTSATAEPRYPVVAWEDGQWRLNTFEFSSGLYTGYQFGYAATIPATTTPPGYSRLTLGKNDFGNGDFYFAEFIFWSTDGIDMQELSDQMAIGFPELYPQPTDLFVVGGDSISTTVYSGLGKSWSRVAFPQTSYENWFNVVQGGWTLQNLNNNRSKITWHQDNIPHTTSYAIIFAGTNDIVVDGLTGAQAFARLITLANNLKSEGFNEFIVLTPLPRFLSSSPQSIAFEPERQDFSDLCVADTSGAIDLVIDLRNIAIGVNGAQDSLTYFTADNVHPNAVGEALIGDYVATFLNAL